VIPGSAADGIPLLIGAEGDTQALERLPLTPEGRGVYDEAWLQRLIHQNPACLPTAEIEPALDSFSSACCEIPTQRGFIDNLLMTGRGDIAIVEAKLFRNPEARRQALAQALDYSTCLFSMGYAEFEKAALAGTYTPRPKPASLYEGLPEPDKLIEAAFVDAVSQNLRRGRVLILVVGDGIRSEAATMLDGLRAHIGFGFTLALVELALFRMPEPDQRLLVRPTTIAKTVITQRTIIETTAGGLVVGAREETLPVAKTISTETYWEALETKVPGAKKALERLIQDAEPLGVYPDFLRSLNLKWDRPGGKAVNLGYIDQRSSFPTIWTDVAAVAAPRELAHSYVQDLATTWGCDVRTLPAGETWTLYKDGRPLRLASVLDCLDDWLGPVQRFISAMAKQDEGS
jgi:hypothetical protein